MQSRGHHCMHIIEAHDRYDQTAELRGYYRISGVRKRRAGGHQGRRKSALGRLGVAPGLNHPPDPVDRGDLEAVALQPLDYELDLLVGRSETAAELLRREPFTIL